MFKGKVMFVVVVVAWAMTALGCAPQSSIVIAANKHNKEDLFLLLGIKFTPSGSVLVLKQKLQHKHPL
jgi:hypothetical protein